ncbi:hypothetical protein HHI36_004879 [Cryptolaemus montrouzieri]|uniref:CCHC-type domain-containing protein n=1 Tax=Cryptolaemus montrouzieri TaxID=559131 RepID=A0ABD2NSI1_9CUCU
MKVTEGNDEEEATQRNVRSQLITLEAELTEIVDTSNPRNNPPHSTPIASGSVPSNLTYLKKIPIHKWGIKKLSARGSSISLLELIDSLRNLLDQIKSWKQDHREQVTVFISTMEAEFNRLTRSIPQQEIIDIIGNSLLPDYVKGLVLHDIEELKILYNFIKIIDLLLAGNIINIIFLRYLNPKLYLQMFVVGIVKNLVISLVIARPNVLFFCFDCGKKGIIRTKCPVRSKNLNLIDVAGLSGQIMSRVQSTEHLST